jgi:hypothetical protein
MSKNKTATEVRSEHGYWLYVNGHSHWGINLYKLINGEYEKGIEITKEMHDNKTEAKLEHYKKVMAEVEAKNKEKEAKEAKMAKEARGVKK